MIDFSHAQLKTLSLHHVSNKLYENQHLVLTETPIQITELEMQTRLQNYFLKYFDSPEIYAFDVSEEGKDQHVIYNIADAFFNNEYSLHDQSLSLARHLHSCTTHPNIKPGDLFVAHLTDIVFDDELIDCLGIFKIENQKSFLTINPEYKSIALHTGIDLERLDKGCIIFNVLKEDGYRIQITDKSNRAFEAHYWRDLFLKIKAVTSDFYQTKNYMNITKSYVNNQMSTDFDIQKADKIDTLNKTVTYFKDQNQFDEGAFADSVFDDPNIISSFNRYKDEYVDAHNIELIPKFEISEPAVKKYQRSFRSVIKLDKNFHIYIHGDKSKIEKGMDQIGKKYYKLYFEDES